MLIFDDEPTVRMLITDALGDRGYAENAVLNHGHLARGREVLTKPLTIDDLVKRVDRMVQDARLRGATGK